MMKKMTIEEIKEMLLRLKSDMQMNEMEWYKFCKRYAPTDRNTSQVSSFLSLHYGVDTRGMTAQIHQALQDLCVPPTPKQ